MRNATVIVDPRANRAAKRGTRGATCTPHAEEGPDCDRRHTARQSHPVPGGEGVSLPAPDFKGAVRIARIEVHRIDGDFRQRRECWKRLAVRIQQAKNWLWLFWWRWHFERGHADQVIQWLDDYRAWAAAGMHAAKPDRKKAPGCPVHPLDAECQRDLYRAIADRMPDVHCKSVGLAMQIEQKNLVKHKATKSAFKQWHEALAGLGLPRFGRPQPIPLNPGTRDKPLIRLIPPADGETLWRMAFRVERTGDRASALDVVTLWTGGRHCAQIRTVLEDVHAGRRKFAGSSLTIDQETGKWYVLLHYREPKAVERPASVVAGRVAVLHAARHRPWCLLVGDRAVWLGGRGRLLPYIRRQCREKAATQREGYRLGARRRRGYDGVGPEESNRLRDYKKTVCCQTAAAAVRIALEHGAETVVFQHPRNPATRFVVAAGSTPGRPGAWPWYQLVEALKNEAEEHGIGFRAVDFAPRLRRKAAGGAELRETGCGKAENGM